MHVVPIGLAIHAILVLGIARAGPTTVAKAMLRHEHSRSWSEKEEKQLLQMG